MLVLDWLCVLGLHLERAAWDILTLAHNSNGRFTVDEEKVTHRLVDEIYVAAERNGYGDRVWVRDFGRGVEAQNGADLELWMIRNQAEGFAWRIQAKRLYAMGPATPPRYDQLDHDVSGTPQCDLLRDSCGGDPHILPMYWLYGFDATHEPCAAVPACRCSPGGYVAGGLLVAHAQAVSAVLAAGGEAKSFHRWGSAHSPSPRAAPLHSYWCLRVYSIIDGPDDPDPFDMLRRVSSYFGLPVEPGPLPEYVTTTMRSAEPDADRQQQGLDVDTVPGALAVIDLSEG